MFEEKLLEPHFTSVLAPYMLDVVEQKRALGNKYNAGVEALSAFDDFCNEQQLRIPAISKELLQKWEKKRPHENETTQCFRISYVRILCKYLHSNGYDAPCAFHPAPHVNKCFVPYIFTKDEIERLFSAVDCTKESSESPLRHLVMPVLFRLLYTCGLRVSEALHLKVADVDLDAGVLAIYGAKGDKERLVGISDSMLTYMKSYRSNPLVANAKSIYFFPAPDGGFYDTSTIYDIFRKCLFDGDNLRMDIRYANLNGTPISVNDIIQGTDFMAITSISNISGTSDYTNLALTHIIPSGWEIYNERMVAPETESGAADGSGKSVSKYNYLDIRDDRVLTYFNLRRGETKVFTVRLQATYAGNFILPAVQCEAMYDVNVQARSKAGRTTVSR